MKNTRPFTKRKTLESLPLFILCCLPLVAASIASPYIANIQIPSTIAGVIGGLVGIVFLFFGIRFFKPILFLAGLAIGALATHILILNLEDKYDFGPQREWLVIAIPAVVGLVIGILFLWVWKLGLVSLGALGGFTLAIYVLSWKTDGVISSPTYRPIFIAGLVVIGALLAAFFERPVIIVCTSLLGSACICSCIDVFAATGFNIAIEMFISNKGSFEFNNSLIGLLASFAVITLVGIFVQYRYSGEGPFNPSQRSARHQYKY
jgi:Domain of unknown function (DUF4203)